jgi:selT/selW/selH-like putative selenoprotein
MQKLYAAIETAVPDVEMSEAVGRTSSFEVVVDGAHTAFSKLRVGTFPDNRALVEEIKAYAATGAAPAGWMK